MLMRMGQGGSVVSYFLFFLEFQPSQWYSEPNVLTSHALIKKIMRCTTGVRGWYFQTCVYQVT